MLNLIAMSKNYLVDTDVLIDFLKGNLNAAAFLEKNHDDVYISAITIAELYAGVRENEERKILDELVDSFKCLQLTAEIAAFGGIYRRDYGRSHGTGLVDALIAASAQSNDCILVSLNRKHYPMLKNLKVPYQK